jgi:hypothetical protein
MRPGDFVESPTGQRFQFAARNTLGEITLQDQAGERYQIGKQSGPVWAWDGAMEAGVSVIMNHLGGRIVADTTRRKP